ncbi:MAG: hypothetical protein AAGA96_04860 [Verrucomicrobiota bacterium]
MALVLGLPRLFITLLTIWLVVVQFTAPISPKNLALVTLFSFTLLLLIGAWLQTLNWAEKHVPSVSDSSESDTPEPDQT